MRRNDREVMEKQQIEEIISKADVCRIAMADGNKPYIVTMNFGYVAGTAPRLYFHCAPQGKKLDILRKNSHVCFEMDIDHQLFKGGKGCDWGMKFSSIVGYGNISVITETKAKVEALNCIMDHYEGGGSYIYDEKMVDKTTILMLEITEMTAKKC